MSLNIIQKFIELDDDFQFVFLDDFSIKLKHPLSEYYLKIGDLSINLFISLKWIYWGYYFLISLSENLKNPNYWYDWKDIINEDVNLVEKKHILILDDEIIENVDNFNNKIKNIYMQDFFDENDKIHFKLKINLREFLIISHILMPAMIKADEELIL